MWDPAAWVWRTAFRLAAGELHRLRRDSPGELLVAGWFSAEVAELAGSTAGTVRVRLHRARGRLRELLDSLSQTACVRCAS